MSLSCEDVAARLGEANPEVEAHLQGCSDCRQASAVVARLQDTAGVPDPRRLAGLALRLATRRALSPREGALRAAMLVIPPVLVALVPSGDWLVWVERLYLVRLPAWGLARIALAASLVTSAM